MGVYYPVLKFGESVKPTYLFQSAGKLLTFEDIPVYSLGVSDLSQFDLVIFFRRTVASRNISIAASSHFSY